MDQTRLAVMEEGRLYELYCQRPDSENLTGNIYLGRVDNVVQGMSAAFVDIGIGKNGFLAAQDMRPDLPADRVLAEALKGRNSKKLPHPGETLLVQVTKSQSGAKGPRLSSQITLPGRLMVLLCGISYVGVSKKISDEVARKRLYEIGHVLTAGVDAGLILRTSAQDASTEALRLEFDMLLRRWREITVRLEHATAPRLLYDNNDLAMRAVRDRLNDRVDALWVDGQEDYGPIKALAEGIAPECAGRVRLHDGPTPLFDLYRVDAQAEKALQKYVWLGSGGSLVIEETEAFTSVDVNTGKGAGKRDVEETVFQCNLEAARELMRQLRLRDTGGIIVVDFIDMEDDGHRRALLEELRAQALRDANHVNVVDITPLGLVEITRKKARQSLSRQLLHTCSHCGGNGVVYSHESTARRAIRDIWRRRRSGESGPILCETTEKVCGWMRTIGVPEGGDVYIHSLPDAEAGEDRLYPVDFAGLPPNSKPLK